MKFGDWSNPIDVRDMVLNMMLFRSESDSLTPWQELRIINTIKTTLLDILGSFALDLPAQYSSQFESHVLTMRNNNSFLEDRDHFFGFLNLYKIQLLDLFGKLHERPDKWFMSKISEPQEDLIPIRGKIANYSWLIDSIYELIEKYHVDNLNLTSLDWMSQTLLRDTTIPVEWLKKWQWPMEIE